MNFDYIFSIFPEFSLENGFPDGKLRALKTLQTNIWLAEKFSTLHCYAHAEQSHESNEFPLHNSRIHPARQ